MKVTADVTKFKPMLHWPAEPDALYTVILSNLDINNRKNRYFLSIFFVSSSKVKCTYKYTQWDFSHKFGETMACWNIMNWNFASGSVKVTFLPSYPLGFLPPPTLTSGYFLQLEFVFTCAKAPQTEKNSHAIVKQCVLGNRFEELLPKQIR